MKLFSAIIRISLVLPIYANAQTNCADFVGTTVKQKSFDQAISSLKSVAPKDEFETTAAYEARLAAADNSKLIVISKPIEDIKYLSYDADAGALHIESYAFNSTVFDAWNAFYATKSEIKASVLSNRATVVSKLDVTTGSYTAQNGFGAKTTVTKVTRTLKAIFEAEERDSSNKLFVNTDSNGVIGALPMSAVEAKVFKRQAKIAFVVIPKKPYVVRSTYAEGKTTINNPIDMMVNATILIADFQCGLLINSANQVLASFETK